jgi:hypothetical protein
MRNSVTIILLSLAFVLSASASIGFDQPYMQKAKDNLQDARSFLNNATADKGGHRANAINLVNSAIDAVNSGIEFDRTHIGNRPNSTDMEFETPTDAAGDQPNMVKARNEVNRAITNLNHATADKGGWRNKALGYCRSAIAEINAGIAFDRHH